MKLPNHTFLFNLHLEKYILFFYWIHFKKSFLQKSTIDYQ